MARRVVARGQAIRASASAPAMSSNGGPPPEPRKCAEPEPIRPFRLGKKAEWVVKEYLRPEDGPAGNAPYRASCAVLFAVAAYLDAGVNDPSIRELCAATHGAYPPSRVVRIISALEQTCWLHVQRGDELKGERNRYSLVLKPPPEGYEYY